jgi:hypothetical protein
MSDIHKMINRVADDNVSGGDQYVINTAIINILIRIDDELTRLDEFANEIKYGERES